MTQSPAFQDPWHAQVMALAQTLVQAGHIDTAHWSDTLGAIRAQQAATHAPDTDASYYHAVYEALVSILSDSDPTLASDLHEMTESWRTAYLTTPHGAPVDLD